VQESAKRNSLALSVKDSEDLQSFYTCDYEYHKSLIPLPVPGTCTWIVQHPKYKAWNAEAQSSILWMSADPGWGKSVLASFLVEELRGDSRTPHEVCYFFFNDNDEDRDNSTSMIRSILHQLFTAQPHLLKCAASQKTTKGQKFLSQFNALWQIFLSAVMDPACANLVLVIDGMDECNLSSRDQFFGALRKVSSDATISTCSSPVLKIFITSRPLESFRSRTFKLPTIFWQVEEEMELINDDISLVVRDSVRRLAARRRLSQDFEDRLAEKLIGSADHTFLWVTLVLEMLERSTNASENALNKIIDTLPTNLDGLYTKFLTQSSDIQMARKILHIVVAAFRPLNLMEINIALAIQPEHDTVEKLRKSLDPSIDYAIREVCGPFIRVNNSKVNLVHQTAKAFLVQKMDYSPAQTNSWKHSLMPIDSNKTLVDACMMYLTLEDFKKDQLLVLLRPSDSDDSDSSESYSSSKSESFDGSLPWIDPEEERTERVIMNYIRRYDFLEYAARYWPSHFRQSGAPSSLNGQVYTLCNEYGSYVVFYNWFYVYARFSSTWNYEIPHCLPELMVASYFGFEVQVQKLLMEDPISVNRTDQMGWTALMYAAVGGHENVIAILLKAGANVNAFGESYHSILREDHSALIVASAHGHDRVVQIFLDHGAQTSTRTESAVSTAAAIGNLDVIRVLLRNGFDIEQQDVEGQTPLHHACLNGRLETFQFLVQEGASIFAKDRRGRCALDMAAEAGALEIVRILLDRGMDVNGADKYGTTAVDLADEFGNHEVLWSLLEHGAEDLWGGKFPTPESPPKENSKEPYTHRLQHFHLNKQDLLGQLPWVFKKILYRQEKTWKPDEFLPSPEEFSQEYARKWKEIVKVHKEIENRK
jgi:ankyrin repeat protein